MVPHQSGDIRRILSYSNQGLKILNLPTIFCCEMEADP
jgi:hypothetical protein